MIYRVPKLERHFREGGLPAMEAGMEYDVPYLYADLSSSFYPATLLPYKYQLWAHAHYGMLAFRLSINTVVVVVEVFPVVYIENLLWKIILISSMPLSICSFHRLQVSSVSRRDGTFGGD
jgi:hypothetical protein